MGRGSFPALPVTASAMLPYPAEGFSEKLGDERGLGGSIPHPEGIAASTGEWKGPARRSFSTRITGQQHGVPRRDMPAHLDLRAYPRGCPGRQVCWHDSGSRRSKQPAQSVPVELDVIDWQLPDPTDFQTYVGCEENPYGRRQAVRTCRSGRPNTSSCLRPPSGSCTARAVAG